MENALLIIHLVLVIFLIAVVMLQRSEGGALGMGGGGGGGVMSGRGAATALQRVTWYIAGGFIATSLALTIIASAERSSNSVFDQAPSAAVLPVEEPAPETFTPPTIDGTEGAAAPSTVNDDTPVPATPASPSAADPDNLVPAPE